MDVIALDGGGFPQAVAPLGTALTEQQIELAWRMASEPILCFDGDPAGQRAAVRAAQRTLPLLKPGYSLRFALLPSGEDPDSLIRTNGSKAMQDVLDKAESLVEVLWRDLSTERIVDTPERRAALERDTLALADNIADTRVREHYRHAFKDRLWAHFRGRGPQGGKNRTMPRYKGRDEAGSLQSISGVPGLPPPPPLSGGAARQEQILLAVLLTHPPLIEIVGERLGMVSFANIELDNLRQEILKHFGRAAALDYDSLRRHLQPIMSSHVLETVLNGTVYTYASYARPGVSDDAALKGWEHVFGLYLHKDLDASLDTAERRLARDISERNVRMLNALKTQKLNIAGEDYDRKEDDPPS